MAELKVIEALRDEPFKNESMAFLYFQLQGHGNLPRATPKVP
jgi:hypothetical protein